MRKAILIKFIQVLLAVLLLNSLVFLVAMSSILLKTKKRDMSFLLRTIEQTANGRNEAAGQFETLAAIVNEAGSRLTLIAPDGRVIADTKAEAALMDSHLDREEVAAALAQGEGYATRYSRTLKQQMLYVTRYSQDQNLIYRLSVPFSGINEYLPLMLPAAWLSFLIAVLVSLLATDRIVLAITRPILKLSDEMMKIKDGSFDFNIEESEFPEINVISNTAQSMARRVTEYLGQIEKEKCIRQEFFSNASHELKTPITSIQGYAELLENRMYEDEEQKQDFIGRIKKEALSMNTLINDILMVSRLETKEVSLEFSTVRLGAVLLEVLDVVNPMAKEKEITIHTDCRPVLLYANEQQMKELLLNLVYNAIKYNSPKGAVWITIAPEEDEVLIEVRDNGFGIPKDAQDRIFERFYRVDKGRSKKMGGTGLGLSIVKHIVSFYQGSIELKSKLGQGSRFAVRIPLNFQNRKQ